MECRYTANCDRVNKESELCSKNLGSKSGKDGKSAICYQTMQWWESAGLGMKKILGQEGMYRIISADANRTPSPREI